MKNASCDFLAGGMCAAVLFSGLFSTNAQVTRTFNGVNPVEVVNLQEGAPLNIGSEGVVVPAVLGPSTLTLASLDAMGAAPAPLEMI
jgi:hypothetical protein